jgi:hypothetical protein
MSKKLMTRYDYRLELAANVVNATLVRLVDRKEKVYNLSAVGDGAIAVKSYDYFFSALSDDNCDQMMKK